MFKVLFVLTVLSLGLLNSCSSRSIYMGKATEAGVRQIATEDSDLATLQIKPMAAPTTGSCYLSLTGDVPDGVKTQWAYGTDQAWTGSAGDGEDFSPAACDPDYLPTACTVRNLDAGVHYYFAVRAVDGNQNSKWSNLVVCRTP